MFSSKILLPVSRLKKKKKKKAPLTVDTHLSYAEGVQAREASAEEVVTTLPRRRVASHNQDPRDTTQEDREDQDPSADVPIRSPVRCVSPEFVSAIALNPGGRPKEVGASRRRLGPPLRMTPVLPFALSRSCSRPPETHAQLPRGLRGGGRRRPQRPQFQPHTHNRW